MTVLDLGETDADPQQFPRSFRVQPEGDRFKVLFRQPVTGNPSSIVVDDETEAQAALARAYQDFVAAGGRPVRPSSTSAKKAKSKRAKVPALPQLGQTVMVAGLLLDDHNVPTLMLRGDGGTWMATVTHQS